MRERERSSALSVRAAISGANVTDKFLRRGRGRRFGEGRADKHAAVIVRAADQDFFPRLRMRRRKIVAVRELLDLFRRELGENVPRQIAQERVAQAVDSLEMLEEQNQALEMRRVQLAIDAVERMGDRMRDRFALQEFLEIKNIVPDRGNFLVLRLGYSPNEQVNFARIVRKISSNLLTYESIRKLRKPETSLDRVVIGDRDKIHSG